MEEREEEQWSMAERRTTVEGGVDGGGENIDGWFTSDVVF